MVTIRLMAARHEVLPAIDFVGHARSLGAEAVKVGAIAELERAVTETRASTRTQVIVQAPHSTLRELKDGPA